MFIKLYLISLPIFLVLDALWLGFIAKNFYSQQIGFLMKTNINYFAAFVFYLLFTAGLVLFVVIPAVEKNSAQQTLFYGLLFGLVTYATYDLTNLATTKDWPVIVTVVDLIWGMIISASVSVASYLIFSKFIAR